MNAHTVNGRIPIRLDPIAGESLDGWLDAYAQRLRVPTVDLAEALGVPRGLRRYPKLALGHDTLDAEQIARRACGIDPAHVRALWVGPARYDRLVTARVRGFILARATRPLAWSRFCPACLVDSGGRWLAAWRLPWYLACATHHTLLACGCPHCHGPQRDRHIRADRVDDLTTLCCRPTGEHAGRGDNRCRHDLTAAASLEPAAPELIAVQAQLIDLLASAISDRDAGDLVDQLVDVLVVATHVGLDLRALTGDRHDATSVLAKPLTEAHRVLADPTGQRLHRLADTPGRPIPHSWNQASPSLDAALLGHRDGRLSPTYRLRYRSMTTTARRPEGIAPTARLHAMPLALWPDWAIRLRPAAIEATNFRIAAAAALCVPGCTGSLRDITRHWQQQPVVDIPRLGRIVTDDRHGSAILRAFCALAETLDRDGAPIDYDRRRAIARDIELLDPDTWATICGAGGMLRGAEFKIVAARLWLWETITGGLVEQAPRLLLRSANSTEFARYRQFAIRLPRQTAHALLEHARELLDTNGCRDEPLTWSPPPGGIAVDELPGPDPDAPDPQAAHALLARQIKPSDVAEQLGITLEHLRYIIRNHPRDSPFGAAGVIPSRLRLAASVTADELRQHVQDGETLTAIAARYNVLRGTLRAKLLAHNIPIPENHRPRHNIDRDWLHEQYVTKQRTMPEIAAETGASPATIARLIQEHAIPTRGRGTPSHQQSLTAGDGYPEPLARAVLRPGGTERVRRFQVCARTRSLNAAAQRLGAHSATLTTQLAALEAACGDTLLERLTRDQHAQQLTPLGRTLLDQADEHLGPHPDAPPALPEPLASVLAAHWGDKSLATFTAAASFPTLEDAADTLNLHRSSLRRTIRNVEAAVGEPVLAHHRPSAPLRLTSIGQRLLRQAQHAAAA
jgi:hypothetical protein